jgi:hypothetical protein
VLRLLTAGADGSGGTERVRIDASGNVGIGTTSPANKLQVRADNGDVLALQNNTVGSAASPALTRLMFNGFANSPKAAIHATDESANFDRGQLIFATKDNAGSVTEKVRIDSAGNVGIGTTSPNASLDIYKSYSAGTDSLRFSFNDGSDYFLGIQSYVAGAANVGYKFRVNNVTTVTDVMAITDAGVGIGTTSPATPLHISKTTDGGIRTTVGSDAGRTTVNYSDGIYGNRLNADSNYVINTTTADLYLQNDYAGNVYLVNGGGNVGIGTASPARKLSIVSSTDDTHLTVGDTAPSFTLTNDPSNPNTATKTAVFALATAAGNYGLNDGELIIGTFGNSRGNIVVNANYYGTGTKDVVLQPSSGNVGIGTTSPGSKLDVGGELRIGNTVNTVSPTSPDRTITMVIGGTTYYIHAKTTND